MSEIENADWATMEDAWLDKQEEGYVAEQEQEEQIIEAMATISVRFTLTDRALDRAITDFLKTDENLEWRRFVLKSRIHELLNAADGRWANV